MHMEKLLALLSVVQLTKQQPLTGYSVAGIKLGELPSLAEHHYTSALSALFLTQKIKAAGGILDSEKLVNMLLIHDLGELFGGDIAAPLNRAYPELREYKDKIGDKAIELLFKNLTEIDQTYFKNLYTEFEHGSSDEKWVGKILDQLDHQLFLEHVSHEQRQSEQANNYRPDFIKKHIYDLAEKIIDPTTKKIMQELVQTFINNYFKRGFIGLNELL